MEETLGKRIAQHRKRLGLTQEQLAEKLGVTAQAVSKWENDISCPDITTLPRLATLFGISTDTLLGHDTVYAGELADDERPSWEFHHNGKKKAAFSATVQDKDGWEFQWDGGSKGMLSFAIFVLLVGGLLLIARALNWDVSFWSITWPSALLVFGAFALVHTPCFTNLVCTLLGGYFLISNLDVLEIPLNKGLIFPALIVIYGVSLLLDVLRKPKKNRFRIHKKNSVAHKTKKHFIQEDERFDANLTFGEVDHQITLPRLSDGNVSVNFGEMDLDLTGCKEIVDGCRIEANVSFGELTLRVPKIYRVEPTAGTSFGEIEIHGHPDPEVKGTIYLDGGVNFGEMIIRYV